MMQRPIYLFTVTALLCGLLASCQPKPPERYLGYSHVDGNSWVKLHALGTSERHPKLGEYVSLRLAYATEGDSIFFRGNRRFQLESSQYLGSFDYCLSTLSEGDSASFALDAYLFFERTLASTLPSFIDSGQMLRINVRLDRIQDSIAFAQEQEEFLHWSEDFNAYERIMLGRFLSDQRINTQPIDSIYYRPIVPGTGSRPQNGDTLTLEFEGRFLNGKYFDSTRKRHEPFVFVLGQQWQVVEGLERAVRMMREGERALFVLPSRLAFGTQGSTTGIVPPYTPVLFDVELKAISIGHHE